MMEIKTFIDELTGDEYLIFDRGNGEFTSVLKSEYDSQQEAAKLGGTL